MNSILSELNLVWPFFPTFELKVNIFLYKSNKWFSLFHFIFIFIHIKLPQASSTLHQVAPIAILLQNFTMPYCIYYHYMLLISLFSVIIYYILLLSRWWWWWWWWCLSNTYIYVINVLYSSRLLYLLHLAFRWKLFIVFIKTIFELACEIIK